MFTDTIAAPATIPGTGAITLIRVSGSKALEVADRLVRFRNGAALSSEGYTVKFGSIYDGGGLLDDVLVSVFRAPHSYTGEDSVEITCHASEYIALRILQMLSDIGVRMALPGEFTRRAYLNGKMDLSQAEAVADLISSTSESAHRLSVNQLKGCYSNELKGLRDQLVEISSLLELELDFSEEDVSFANRSQLQELLDRTISHIERLEDSFRTGNAIRNGIPVTLVGETNSGKSTLLNALLGEDRAIVSDEAGTTRDTVEDTLVLGGMLFRLIDTAGIRKTSGKVEKIGIERSLKSLNKADVVVLVLDASEPYDKMLKSAESLLPKVDRSSQTLVVVRNKVDIFDRINPEEYPLRDSSYHIFELKYPAFGSFNIPPEQIAKELGVDRVIDISAMTGEGLDELRSVIVSSQKGRIASAGSCSMVSNLRHYEALSHAADALYSVRNGLSGGSYSELISEDLRTAITHLNSIFGDDITSEDVLGEIFRNFCIGK